MLQNFNFASFSTFGLLPNSSAKNKFIQGFIKNREARDSFCAFVRIICYECSMTILESMSSRIGHFGYKSYV